LSSEEGADETGLVGGGIGDDGWVYITEDESGSNDPTEWAKTIVDACVYSDFAGVVTETNRGGKMARMVLTAECQNRTPKVRVQLVPDDKPFAPRIPGVLQLKEINTKNSKTVRGEGARVFGNVHHVGTFAELEEELTTYDGTGQSPNRFDAFNYLVNELAGLSKEAKAPPPPQKGYGALVDAMRGTGTRRAI
jgi:phage terminase large subunit-like protein